MKLRLRVLAPLALAVSWALFSSGLVHFGATDSSVVAIHFKLAEGSSWTEVRGAVQHAGDDFRIASIAPIFQREVGALPLPLDRWHRIVVETTRLRAEVLVARLLEDPRILSAFVEPEAVPAWLELDRAHQENACPVKTPLYLPLQGYLGEAPMGINAPVAWAEPGGRGEGIWFADVEGGWNMKHEDIPGERMELVAGQPFKDRGWEAHGTAVVGEIASRENAIGMLGIAPNVERILVASIGKLSTAGAIDRAASRLPIGGVLLIELHAIGPRGRWMPVELWDDVFDAVKAATDRGVVVVAAAGNGGEDLDHPAYKRRLDRTFRDSGAILVGAGAPPVAGFWDRSRLDFSNYGSRVDVQGWGRMVATLDYGDLQGCSTNARKYTRTFSGTSSASPIVTGAAILLQGIHHARTGGMLTSVETRKILSETGSPQMDGPDGPTTQRIGPRPNLASAIARLDRLDLVSTEPKR